MSQSRIESAIEASANIGSGFIIAWAAWVFIVPLIWPELATPASQGFWITVLFTFISFTRSYVWRRIFNRIPKI